MAENEIKTLAISFLGSFCMGWWSKVMAVLTDPILSLAYQTLARLGWVGILIVVALLLRQMYDDYLGYVAIGMFAVPAILTFFLPWDTASTLMLLSFLGLSLLGVDAGKRYFRL